MKQLLMVCDESILSVMLEYWKKLAEGECIFDGNCINCKENEKISTSSAVTCCHRLMDLLPQIKCNAIKVNFKIFDTILSSKFKFILAICQMTDECADFKQHLNELCGEEIEFNQFIAWGQEYASKLFLKHIISEEYPIKLFNIMNDLCEWLHMHAIQSRDAFGIATNKRLELDGDNNACHNDIIFTLNTIAKTKEISRFKVKLKEFIENTAIDNVKCNVSFFCDLLNVLRYLNFYV